MKREDEIARVTITGSVVNLLLVGLKAVAVKTLPKGALVEIECIAAL